MCTCKDIREREFQLTAARRRLAILLIRVFRPRTSFNSQPPGGGWQFIDACCVRDETSFNSQPPGGGWGGVHLHLLSGQRFNSQPPGGGWHLSQPYLFPADQFQLTAARRRLDSDHWTRIHW